LFITKTPFYLLWNKAITITINWHNAITHITISNIIIWHPSFSQEQNRPTAMCTTLAALRYIFYHTLPHPSIYFWKYYGYYGNIPPSCSITKNKPLQKCKGLLSSVILFPIHLIHSLMAAAMFPQSPLVTTYCSICKYYSRVRIFPHRQSHLQIRPRSLPP